MQYALIFFDVQLILAQMPRPLVGGNAGAAAPDPRVGLERRPMLQQRQRAAEARHAGLTAADPCYALAASCPTATGAPASA